jgi:hypothetical protein
MSSGSADESFQRSIRHSSNDVPRGRRKLPIEGFEDQSLVYSTMTKR